MDFKVLYDTLNLDNKKVEILIMIEGKVRRKTYKVHESSKGHFINYKGNRHYITEN